MPGRISGLRALARRFAEHTPEGSMWVITPKEAGVGGDVEGVVAKCASTSWWPWDTEGWKVCGKHRRFTSAPGMGFQMILPAAELCLSLRLPLLDRRAEGGVAQVRFRGSHAIHGRPAYSEVGGDLRLFWMPKMSRPLARGQRRSGGCGHGLRDTPCAGSPLALRRRTARPGVDVFLLVTGSGISRIGLAESLGGLRGVRMLERELAAWRGGCVEPWLRACA